jgi:hypothetical protein
MKKLYFLLIAGAALSLSCSNNDDATANTVPPGEGTFLPVTTGNYWVYNVQGSLENGRDSLYVSNDTVIGAYTYKKLKTKETPSGFFSGALNNNGIRKEADKLLVTGSTSVNFSEEFPFSIAITDLVMFKESAINGEELGRVTGSLNQNYNSINFKLDYALTTTAKEDVASMTVNGEVFTNVKTVETKINLKISLVDFPAEILPAQDVLISQQYYAENVGVVKTTSTFTYQINSTLAVSFGIPASANETQQELITNYNAE